MQNKLQENVFCRPGNILSVVEYKLSVNCLDKQSCFSIAPAAQLNNNNETVTVLELI